MDERATKTERRAGRRPEEEALGGLNSRSRGETRREEGCLIDDSHRILTLAFASEFFLALLLVFC